MNGQENNKPTEKSTVKLKKLENRWTLKQRILYSLLLSLTGALTVFVFGPMNIFGNNVDEFEFVMGDFIGFNILYTIATVAIIMGILVPLKGVIFEYAYGFFFALTFILFIQGNYLNFDLHSLGADADAKFDTSTVVINTIIWVVVIALIILAVALLRKKHLEIIKTVSTIALVTIIGMQLITTALTALSGDAFISHGDRVEAHKDDKTSVLTYDNLTELSTDKNIIYFVIDRFDWRFCKQAMEEAPEIFDELSGFTCYADAMSLYPSTYPSVVYMLTGHQPDWKGGNIARKDFFENSFKNADFLKTLKDNNYRVNLYTDKYYVYENATCMDYYASNSQPTNYGNYKIVRPAWLSWKMSGLSMFRYLPYFAKNSITVSTESFAENIKYDTDIYDLDMRDLYNALTKGDFTTFSGQNNFSFIHFTGTHTPFLYDENFNEVKDNQDVVSATKQSFKIINRYLQEMKRLDLYKDATIVITGDHGWSVEDGSPYYVRTTPIFFKESGSEGELKMNSAPVTHSNLFASILKSEGINYETFEKNFGKPLCEVKESDKVERMFYFTAGTTIKDGSHGHEVRVFKVNGSARDPKSWKSAGTIYINKNMYD